MTHSKPTRPTGKNALKRLSIFGAALGLALAGTVATGLSAEAATAPAPRVHFTNFTPASCSGGRLMALATTTGVTGSVYMAVQGNTGQGRHQRLHENPRTNHHSETAPWGGGGHGAAAGIAHFRVTGGSTQCNV